MARRRKSFNPLLLLVVPPTLFALGAFIRSGDSEAQFNSQLLKDSIQGEVQLNLESNHAETQIAQAEERYRSGICVEVPDPHTIQYNQIYLVPKNSRICDTFGNTAIIGAEGEVTSLARTNNQTVIREFLGW